MEQLNEWLSGSVQIALKYGTWGLFVIAFVESSFFPIPPDLILIPLALADPQRGLWYAAICTAGSVLGAYFGYWIGRRFGRPVLRRFASESQIDRIDALFATYGGWAVGIAGFTPIPYKVFTISAGLFRQGLWTFTVASILSRGARFFLEAVLIELYGASIVDFISRYFELLTVAVTIVVVAAVWLWRRLHARHA